MNKIILLLLAFLLVACQSKTSKKEQYTCPMHPEIIREKPGTCPVCGMDLVKITLQEALSDTSDLAALEARTDQNVVSRIKTISPEYGSKNVFIEAVGKIDYDSRTYTNITARFSGRIEKLYLKTAFQKVDAGQKILELYSPEVATAAQDFLFALNNSGADKNLIESARQKLILMGMSSAQVNTIAETKKVSATVTVYSPYSGHIHVMAPGKETQTSSDARMLQETAAPEPPLKEGAAVEKGQNLFSIVDPQEVWAVLKIYADDISLVKKNQEVQLYVESDTAHAVEGKVDFVQTFYEGTSKGLSIRVFLNNAAHGFKVGMLLSAKIKSSPVTGFWIPRQAVLNTGKKAVVMLQKGRSFEAHSIQEGVKAGEWIQVSKGLEKTDKIAVNARYLMDSESLIKIIDDEN
jgi:Cu(I)/Ag(I) efflux system membrane fusion protein